MHYIDMLYSNVLYDCELLYGCYGIADSSELATRCLLVQVTSSPSVSVGPY